MLGRSSCFALALMVLVALAPHADARASYTRFAAPNGVALVSPNQYTGAYDGNVFPADVGGAHVAILPGESHVFMWAWGDGVPFSGADVFTTDALVFHDATGRQVGSLVTFCTFVDLSIPAGAASFDVYAGNDAVMAKEFGAPACGVTVAYPLGQLEAHFS